MPDGLSITRYLGVSNRIAPSRRRSTGSPGRVGAALAVPAVAIAAITRPPEALKPIDFLVMRPARYTFGDPIGTH